jgi:hypothetical protein
MPAELVPHEAIPDLAARVDPQALKILRGVQRDGFILNGPDVDPETADILQQLANLGLVDPGYDGPTHGKPYLWVSNGNDQRVLKDLTGIRSVPHYEIPSSELAAWLEEQGKDRWWNVDGDPLLTGRMTFPCPADELAAELRKIDRPLLVQAKKEDIGAMGQRVPKDKLDELVGHFVETNHPLGPGPMPPWGRDRLLYLCWKGSTYEWLLEEDSETTEQSRADEAVKAK